MFKMAYTSKHNSDLLLHIPYMYIININWRDVQRKNVVNNEGMSSLRAPWKNGLYKNQHTEEHVEHHHDDATDI